MHAILMVAGMVLLVVVFVAAIIGVCALIFNSNWD
jgi:hypothetical protein